MSDPLAHIADPTLERLSAFLDGDLDSADRADVERELSATPELQAALDAMRRSHSMIRRHGGAMAPADFADRVLAAVEKEPVPISRARGWRRPMGVPVEIWALAAAAILVVGVGLRARTMEFGGSAEIKDDTPSPATFAPEPKETEKKGDYEKSPPKANPVQSMAPANKKGTVDLSGTATLNTGGTAEVDPAQNTASTGVDVYTTNLPGTAAGTRVVGETTGWNFSIQTNDEDVITKLNRIAAKNEAKVTTLKSGDDGSQSLWVDVPSDRVNAFTADLNKVGVVSDHPDVSKLQTGANVRMLVTIEAPPETPAAKPSHR